MSRNDVKSTHHVSSGHAQQTVKPAISIPSPIPYHKIGQWLNINGTSYPFLAEFIHLCIINTSDPNDEQCEFMEALLNRILLLSTPNIADISSGVQSKFDSHFKSNKFWELFTDSIINYLENSGPRAINREIVCGFLFPLPINVKVPISQYIFDSPELMSKYGNFFLDEEEDFEIQLDTVNREYKDIKLDDSKLTDENEPSISSDDTASHHSSPGSNLLQLSVQPETPISCSREKELPSTILSTIPEEKELADSIICSSPREQEENIEPHHGLDFPNVVPTCLDYSEHTTFSTSFGSNSRGKQSKMKVITLVGDKYPPIIKVEDSVDRTNYSTFGSDVIKGRPPDLP